MTNPVNHQPPPGSETTAPGTASSSTALLTDHYELTMLEAALRSGAADRRAIFEVFARHLPHGRRYGVVAGTGRLLDAIERFRFGPADLEFLGRAGTVDWTRGIALAIGGVATMPLGVAIAHRLPERALRAIFGAVALVSAVGLFFRVAH